MYVTVNGDRLFFDVEGLEYPAEGPRLKRRPTVILLHGGPGADHAVYKPAYSALSDVAQVIYLDHRGNGRSDDSEPTFWNLDQWADDLAGFCDALGIERPVILGTSFGGFVAQAFAARYPDRLSGLILISTAAKFEFEAVFTAFRRLGGREAEKAARDYWTAPTVENRQRYHEVCFPLYTRRPYNPDFFSRIILKNPVALHFNGMANEQARMDFRDALGAVTATALVLCGADDQITPPEFSELIARRLPDVRLEIYDDCGHGVVEDQPEAAFTAIRAFLDRCMVDDKG